MVNEHCFFLNAVTLARTQFEERYCHICFKSIVIVINDNAMQRTNLPLLKLRGDIFFSVMISSLKISLNIISSAPMMWKYYLQCRFFEFAIKHSRPCFS